MSYYLVIDGKRWYYRLKEGNDDPSITDNKNYKGKTTKGLFSDIPRSDLINALIVSLSYREGDKVYRLFTHFKSYLEYGIYQMRLPQSKRCF